MWTWKQLQQFVRHGSSSQMAHADRVRQAELDRRRRHGLGEPSDDDMIDIAGMDIDLTPLATGLSQPMGTDSTDFEPIHPVPGYIHMGDGVHTWDAPRHDHPTVTPEPTPTVHHGDSTTVHHSVADAPVHHVDTSAPTVSYDSGSASYDSGSAPSVDPGM